MKAMQYKGYAAKIEYSDEDACFVGHIDGIRDIVGFHGSNVQELRSGFEEAVDDYLELCSSMGKSPDKVYSGRIVLRVSPALHEKMAKLAGNMGISLNSWLVSRLVGPLA